MKFGKKKEGQTIADETMKTKRNSKMVGRFFKRHKGITVLICIVIIGSVVGVTVFGNTKKKPKMPGAVAFETMTLEKRDISNSISVTGTIASADSRTLTSTLSNIDVESLNVAVGDKVNAGDVLVVFDDTDLTESLSDAKKSLSVSQAQAANELESAQRSYTEAGETAQISASRAAESVSNAYSTYTKAVSAEASSKLAYQEAVQAEETLQKEAATLEAKVKKLETEIAQLQTELKSADESKQESIQSKITKKQTSLAAAQKEYEEKSTEYKTAQQETTTAKQSYEQAATSLENSYSSYTKAVQDQEDTTRNNESTLANQASSLENTKLNVSTSSQNQEDQVETIQEQIDDCTVTAPISGVVTSLSVSKDETFAGGEILVIQDNSSFIVEANVDEYDIADIEKGMSVVIKTDATGDEELEGEVIYVAPTPRSSTTSSGSNMEASSSGSSTYEVQISVKTANDRLRIGMSAKASILTESRENVYAVPYDAIETNENGELVIYVVDNSQNMQNKKAIAVEVGLESDYYTEISSDELEEGMSVITGNAGQSVDSEKSDNNDMNGMFGGMGGGNMNGGGAPGGMSGGGPGRR